MNKTVLFSSASDRWATPSEVKAALYTEFALDFDPCPLDGAQDGLATLFCPWHGKRVFCNPPYGPQIGRWIERAFDAEMAVFLLPARTDTRWFMDLVLPRAKEIRFIRGRLKFGGAKNSAPFPSLIAIFERGFHGSQIITEFCSLGQQRWGNTTMPTTSRGQETERNSQLGLFFLGNHKVQRKTKHCGGLPTHTIPSPGIIENGMGLTALANAADPKK